MNSKAGSILKFLFIWLLSGFLWGGVALHASNPLIIKGIVSDQDNYPLAGAAVLVKGTSDGTIADEKG